jgi:hypothetical protein
MDRFEDVIFFYVIGVEADSREKRGSIFRNFVAGKSPITFQASALIHFMHSSALRESTLLKSCDKSVIGLYITMLTFYCH